MAHKSLKVFGIGMGLTAVVGGGAGIHAELSDQNAPPESVIRHYEGLPIPAGDLISKQTDTALIANLQKNGNVEISAKARGRIVMQGSASCYQDALQIEANILKPNDFFTSNISGNYANVGKSICAGDRVAARALSRDNLPAFIGRQLMPQAS